jgi:hypothetical protein
MKDLIKLFQRTIIICVVFIACHSRLFAQGEPISAFLGVSKKSFTTTCLEKEWKFTINKKGSMNFDYPGGNCYVSFNEDDIIDLINLTSFGKEKGELMMQKLTSDAYLVNDNAAVTRWRHGNRYLMYFKMFQPNNGSSILISDDFFLMTNPL